MVANYCKLLSRKPCALLYNVQNSQTKNMQIDLRNNQAANKESSNVFWRFVYYVIKIAEMGKGENAGLKVYGFLFTFEQKFSEQ